MQPDHLGLLSTLVLSLVAAFAGGLAVRTIRLPPLLGYILAGVMIGPFTPGPMANQAIASELAEIGVALLLFNIGMHFSFKDLLSVRKVVLPGALFQITMTTTIGAALTYFMIGGNLSVAIITGLSFAIASTAVATRILEERRQTRSLAGRVALGWLVVQDIVVIIALVLLPALANIAQTSPSYVLTTLGKTALQITGFFFLMVFGGRRFIPWVLNYVARIGSRELFTLSVIVMALGIAYGSSILFGVSLAMGAFFAGVVIGESDLNHHAASEALSIQQVFTILFFVSVGMLFDPSIILERPFEITASLLTVIFGTGILTAIFLFVMGLPLYAVGLIGAAFAQIGEFSFVLSQIGFKDGLFGVQERDLIMSVAFLSILVNPLILTGALALIRWAEETPLLASLRGRRMERDTTEPQILSSHVILVGHGRVGGIVADALREQNIPSVIIETDRTLVDRLRREGLRVIYGDASREAVCAAAAPQNARLMVIAVHDAYYAKQIVRQALKMNPALDIVVRTHSDKEARSMTKLGVGFAVMGEREIGFGMASYALYKLDLSPEHARETINKLREQAYSSDMGV